MNKYRLKSKTNFRNQTIFQLIQITIDKLFIYIWLSLSEGEGQLSAQVLFTFGFLINSLKMSR